MVRVAHRGGGGTSTGSGWRTEGERDLRPVGWLSMLASQRVGSKAIGLTGLELKRNSFRNKNWIFEFTKALEIYTRRFMIHSWRISQCHQ
jgi:hypothetical protein